MEYKFSGEIAALILDGLPMGVLFCDRDGLIRFVNAAYAQLLDKKPEELIGSPITRFIPHSRAREVMENGRPEMGELCQLGSSSSQPVIVNRLPVRDRDGEISGMISQALFNDPEELKRLSSKIERLGRKLSHYKKRFEASLAPQYTFASILGESPVMRGLKSQAANFARYDEPILILGPTGAGKELFAHAAHAASPRSSGPLVCVNCAALPRDLFESELFGYASGAFSGARQDGKMGQIELADKGTLFLDEIGETPPDIQAKLLRVLESRSVRRLGAVSATPIDFRLIAATNRNIDAMLKNGSFREDLYYRINTFALEIPPLCERGDDIPLLARSVLRRMGLEHVVIPPDVEEAMLRFSWPGNVRQLRNAVARAATVRVGNVLQIADFPPETLPSMTDHPAPRSGDLSEMMASAEAVAVKAALDARGGNVAATARDLRVARATLYEKIRKFGIVVERKKNRE